MLMLLDFITSCWHREEWLGIQHILGFLQAEGSSCHQRALSLCVWRAGAAAAAGTGFPFGLAAAGRLLKETRTRKTVPSLPLFCPVNPRWQGLSGEEQLCLGEGQLAAGTALCAGLEPRVYSPKTGGSGNTLFPLVYKVFFTQTNFIYTWKKNLSYLSLTQNLVASVSDMKKDLCVPNNLFVFLLPLFHTQI